MAQNAYQDRIKKLVRMRIGDAEPHPKNHRTHPIEQSNAVRSMLAEVGIVDVALAFPADGKGPNGNQKQLMLYDGHLRQNLAPDQVWPVAVTDLTRREADKVIALLDKTTEMADEDDEILAELLATIEAEDAELKNMIKEMQQEVERAEKTDSRRTAQDKTGPASMLLRPHENYDYVLILATTKNEWNMLAEMLELRQVKRATKVEKYGTGRAIFASRLFELFAIASTDSQDANDDRETSGRNPVAQASEKHAPDVATPARRKGNRRRK